MASLAELAKQAQKFTIDNSPLVLTAIGAAGVITTAVLSVRSGLEAQKILEQHESALRAKRSAGNPIPTLDRKEAVRLTWKVFLPPVASTVLTCGAIIGANQIGTRRAAALAAAYTISEKAFDEYREAVIEKIGDKKERAVRDDMAQHRMNNSPIGDREIVIVSGKSICFDGMSGRYFESSMEDIKFAINKINNQINNENYASLTDLYHELGLSATQGSDEVGWNIDKLLDIHITTTLTEKGEPALSLDYRVKPIRDYFRVH